MQPVVVVIPCFNEEQRLRTDALEGFAASHPQVRLLLVDDGSHDGTLGVLERLAGAQPERILVLPLPVNGGKGEAVRQGVLHALRSQPRAVGYWDADLATPIEAVDEFVALLDGRPELDLVMGSRVRLLGRHVERRASRHYLGRVFATATSLVLGAPVYDTQCGAKVLRVNERTQHLFDQPFQSRWIFDVELLARYLDGPGDSARIAELPLTRWEDVQGSKLKARDFARAALDLAHVAVRRRGSGRRSGRRSGQRSPR